PSAVVAVLKELLARQVAALPDDSGKASIVELQFVRHAALPAEDEPHLRSRHLHVPVPHRRQAVRVVVARVLFVADANERLLEQPDDRGEDFRARKARSPQVGVGTTTNPGKRAAEVDEAAVLARVADLAPLRVIAVLLAAARVAAGRLEMTARVGPEPDGLPRRRDHQRADTVQIAPPHGLPARGDIPKRALPAEPADAGLLVCGVDQTGLSGRRRRRRDRGRHGRIADPQQDWYEVPAMRIDSGLPLEVAQSCRTSPSEGDRPPAVSMPRVQLAEV